MEIINQWKLVPNRYNKGMKSRTDSLNARPLTEKQRWAY